MKRLAIILLAVIFCFLAYLEAMAQEVTINISVSSEEGVMTVRENIFQTIDFALEIICAERAGRELKFTNGIPVCAEREHD